MRRSPMMRTIIKITVSVGLLAFLISKISINDLLDLVRQINRPILGAAVLVFFLSNLVGSLQWHLLLGSSGVVMKFGRTFKFYFVGLFFNNFLPANIGGDAVKVYDVARIGSSVYQVIAVTFLDRLIGIFGLCTLATVSLIVLMNLGAIESGALYLIVFIGCMVPPLGFYFIEPLGGFLRWVVGRFTALGVNERASSILDYMGHFKAKKRFIMRLVLLSMVIQWLRVSTHVLVGYALGLEINPIVVLLFFVFVPLLSLAMIPPITINGLGIREGLGILLFAQARIDGTDAFTLEFLTYLVSVAVSLLGFLFFIARKDRGSHLSDNITVG